MNLTIEVDSKKIKTGNQTTSKNEKEEEGEVVTTKIKYFLNYSNFDFPLHCKVLDWDQFNVTKEPIKIRIIIDKIENISIRLLVEEKNKLLRRRNMEKNLLTYFGPDITNEDLSKGKILNFYFSLSQEINSELDVDKYCKNYPTKQYSSFRDCDEKNLYSIFMESNLMPYWVAKHINETTIDR